MLRIGLDIDDTLACFIEEYQRYFKTDRYPYRMKDAMITKNVARILKGDRKFWLGLPVKRTVDFEPTLYCTARTCAKRWSKEWLVNNDFPNSPVYQIYGHGVNKARFIKGKVDVFVDDSVMNFLMLNRSGVPCLLIDGETNKDWGPVGKIYSLDYDEILEGYNLLKEHPFVEV